MFRKEFLIMCSLAAGIFLLVAAACYWVAHTIQRDASDIALDTLPSLVDAGAAISLAQDNWLRVQLLLTTQSAAEQSGYIAQIQTNSTDLLWRDYGQNIYTAEDQRNYDNFLVVRTNFMKLRNEFYTLVQQGRLPEAKGFLQTKLSPAYDQYRASSKTMFDYNATVGRQRAASVIRFARAAPYVLGFVGVLVFGLGVLFGLRGALAGLDLASRSRKS